eukprot:s3117_g6.t1
MPLFPRITTELADMINILLHLLVARVFVDRLACPPNGLPPPLRNFSCDMCFDGTPPRSTGWTCGSLLSSMGPTLKDLITAAPSHVFVNTYLVAIMGSAAFARVLTASGACSAKRSVQAKIRTAVRHYPHHPARPRTGSDLAYRAVLPIKLGNALCTAASMEPSPALEHFATLRQPLALQQEIRALSKARAPHAPAIHLTKCLLLGIRRLRQAYQAHLDAWIQLCRIAIPPSLEGDAQACSAPASAGCGLLTPHLVGNPARLRWALLRPPAALAKLRAMGPCGRLADSALLAALAQHGAAVGSCPPRLCPCLERSATVHVA